MNSARIITVGMLALFISVKVDALSPPIKVPKDVVDTCRAQLEFTFQECMARHGWPSGNIAIEEKPACNLNTCLAVVSSQIESMTQTVDGETITIPYRSRLEFIRPTASTSDWSIGVASGMNLYNFQRLVHSRVQTNLPPNTCQVENKVSSQSDSVSGDVYVYQATIQSAFQACANVPCFPEVWKTCVGKTDLGKTDSQLIVKVRFYVEDSKLKVVVNSDFTPGPTPGVLHNLFNLEQFFNFATGGLFRSGNERQYRESVQNAITAAIAQSGEKISQRLNVPGGQAFKFQIGRIHLSIQDNQLMFGLNARGVVPSSMVCDVRQSLLEQPNQTCERER